MLLFPYGRRRFLRLAALCQPLLALAVTAAGACK